MTPSEWARSLRRLLPPSRVLRTDVGSVIYAILLWLGDELSRIDGRGRDLVIESNPITVSELLTEQEAELGLDGTGLTLEERVGKCVALLVRRQRVRPVDYQELLATVLGLSPGQVDVIENSRAFCVATGNDREIYHFYVFRDPSLGGSYSISAAQDIVDEVEHSYTYGQVIESIDFLCDDQYSLCDRDLLGA